MTAEMQPKQLPMVVRVEDQPEFPSGPSDVESMPGVMTADAGNTMPDSTSPSGAVANALAMHRELESDVQQGAGIGTVGDYIPGISS